MPPKITLYAKCRKQELSKDEQFITVLKTFHWVSELFKKPFEKLH